MPVHPLQSHLASISLFKESLNISLPAVNWITCSGVDAAGLPVFVCQSLRGLKVAGRCQSANALMSWLIFLIVTGAMGEGLLPMIVLTKGQELALEGTECINAEVKY